MLKVCSKTELKKYIDFAYGLALDITKSGYPTYCDGVKIKEMFVERLNKAFVRETEEILLFEYEGNIEGLIHYFWIPADNYLETSAFNINKGTEQAMSELFELLGERFPGYDLYLGFPEENQTAIRYLQASGCECIENDYNNIAILDKIDHIPEPGSLIRIGLENYEAFRKLHDQMGGDMYWSSDRILADFDNWVILAAEKDGKPLGAIYYVDAKDGWYEVFGIDMDGDEMNPDILKDLLHGVLSDIKNRGGRVVTCFSDEDTEKEMLECGFTCVGRYICHKIRLAE